MSNEYYETIKSLEESGVKQEYVVGWASGYLGNPVREEQRVTEPYQVGYEDGRAKTTDNAEKFKN